MYIIDIYICGKLKIDVHLNVIPKDYWDHAVLFALTKNIQ